MRKLNFAIDGVALMASTVLKRSSTRIPLTVFESTSAVATSVVDIAFLLYAVCSITAKVVSSYLGPCPSSCFHWKARALLVPSRAERSLHIDGHAHPGMDAALKTMRALRQVPDLDFAALENSSLRHSDVGKATCTFGNRVFSRRIESWYEAATELRHLGECVRLAALVDHAKRGSLLYREHVRFEIPARIGSSSGCLGKQVVQPGECSERDIPAEIKAKRGIECSWIAFVQGHDLGCMGYLFLRWSCLCHRECRAGEHQAAGG